MRRSCMHFRGQITSQNKLSDKEKFSGQEKKYIQFNKAKKILLFNKNSQLHMYWKNKNWPCDNSSGKCLRLQWIAHPILPWKEKHVSGVCKQKCSLRRSTAALLGVGGLCLAWGGSRREMRRLAGRSPGKNDEIISPGRKAWNSRTVQNPRGRGSPDNGWGIPIKTVPGEGKGMVCLCLQQVGPRTAVKANLALGCTERMRNLHHCRVLRAVCTNICQK